jgi:DNA-binding NarL/FixJ family response regulator
VRGERPPNPTRQELRVITLMAVGKVSKEIATELGIAVSTVDTHRTNLYRKMRFGSLADIVHYALARGLVLNKFNLERVRALQTSETGDHHDSTL